VPSSAPSASGFSVTAGEAWGERALAKKRLERARQTLEGYLLGTRYPYSSRPMSEHPDLVKPHGVARTTLPLARKDQKLTDARVLLEQDRLYVVGEEAAKLTLTCTTSEGPALCEVLGARAHAADAMTNAPMIEPSAVQFVGDGVKSALFAPAQHGFGGYHGPISIDLDVRVDGEEGGARFEVIYTPAAPARFTRKVREEMVDGSLHLHVQVDVDKPGRYVIVARVDDTTGDGFAYLEFNDELEQGLQDVKLCIFGKLVHDEQAHAPFVLRDIEGFLLKESHPDRETMVGYDGPYYTTKSYDLKEFSDTEWQSEEKARHVDEFTKDVRAAEEALRLQEEGTKIKP